MEQKTTKVRISYPIALNQAKRHLRIDNDFNEDDDYIQSVIKAATGYCENYIGRDISYTRNTLVLRDYTGSSLRLNEGGVIAVESATGPSTTYTVSDTTIYEMWSLVEFSESFTADPLTMTFTTGYNNDCPEDIQFAILAKVGDIYDMERNSYSYSAKRSNVIEMSLDSYKMIYFQ